MARIDLPSGGWVELVERSQITERQRRAVRLSFISLSPEARGILEDKDSGPEEFANTASKADVEAMFAVNDVIAAASISAWSYPPAPPLTPEQITDLPTSDYDFLLTATAPLGSAFFGVDLSVSPEPSSPT